LKRRRVLVLLLILLTMVLAALVGLLLVLWGADRPAAITGPGWKHVRTLYGWGSERDQQFAEPFSVAWAGDSLYVTEKARPSVVRLTEEGRLISLFEAPEDDREAFRSPMGVDVDRQGRVYVTDGAAKRLVVFESSGEIVQQLEVDDLPLAPRVDSNRLLLTTRGSLKILALPDLGEVANWGARGRDEAEFDHPNGLAFDAQERRIYVSDGNNLRVKALDEAGDVVWVFGKPPSSMNERDRSFGLPAGMALANGHLFVVDALDGVIHILDREGQEVAQVGSMGAGDGQLLYPSDIVHMYGNRFAVCEWKTQRVQIVEIDVEEAIAAWAKPASSPAAGGETTAP
jgi:hypothetical protein